jgi:hypothetical protein
MADGKAWKWAQIRRSEKVQFRVTPSDALRGAEVGDRLGIADAELNRRAWLMGLELIEREDRG